MRLIQRCSKCRRFQRTGKVCRCGVKLLPEYWVEYRKSGKLLREKVGDKDIAQIRLAEISRSILEHRYLSINKNAVKTISDVVDFYINLPQTKSLRSYEEIVRSLKYISAGIGPGTPATMPPIMVSDWVRSRLESGLSEATVNREVSYLKAAFNRAVEYRFIETNPISGLRMLKEDNHRDVGISEDDLIRLVSLLPPWCQDLTTAAFYTMMRRGELLALERSHINHEISQINLTPDITKNKKPRTVPIPETIRSIFKKRCAWCGGKPIFDLDGYSVSSFSKTFSKAVLKANLGDFHFHDLRHSGAQWYYENGNDIPTIMQVGGWSSFDMLKRYLFNANKQLNVKFG